MPHWKNVFIELALYSLRKVHTQYQLWSLGSLEKTHCIGLNQSEGILLAYETDVCSAISQEFLSSVSRFKITENEGIQVFKLWREFAYQYDTQKRCDLVIQKNGQNDEEFQKAYIEAKRWVRASTNLCDEIKSENSPQIVSIMQDIEKLQEERKHTNDDIIPCLLIWGVSENPTSPVLNNKTLKPLLNKEQTISENVPVKWDSKTGKIKEWLWVTLAEVKT
ncbi:hypothetical protein ALTERO38_40013 [Alteromonas sp. 38]|uniref:hypothetical protein n=2 Tax=unclassified Alteromonas TaxID=2614992 RepID=UPI0012F35E33|nr:hypothetical protein [Alteromonas sp. 38]CAD5292378.1 hypothetical protein ALTER154_90238 [Alteromonas sp. 154]VXB15309.1 hypothetical protein ALTERO38_40013 [Alteromonas sp. 38]